MKMEKSIKFLTVLVVFAMCGSIWAVEPNDPSLVAWWEFDEGAGTTAYDSAASNNGTIYGAQWTGGTVGSALDFDGDNDYVEIPDNSLLTPHDKITISFWLYNRGGQTAGIYKYASCTTSRAYYIQVSDSTGKAQLRIFSAVYTYDDIVSTNAVSLNSWHNIAATFDQGQAAIYIDGQLDNSTTMSVSSIMNDYHPLIIGGHWNYCGGSTNFESRLNGVIDDVHIYNRALSAGEIYQLCQEGMSYKAFAPNPADGVGYVNPNTVLSWLPGKDANSHDVYLGTDYNDVNDANTGSPEYQGRYDVTPWDPCGLELETTYYWRIDEINEPNTCKGDVWSFTTKNVSKAFSPDPDDGAEGLGLNTVFSWSAGADAAFHDVYFGTDYNDVNDATTGSSEYQGRYDVTSWDPCGLELDTTYYWRIDEINGSHTCKGDVWSFTTRAVEGIITVGPGGPAGGYDFGTIQEGIDAAFEGEEVVVVEGTYVGIGNRNLNFGGKAITVRSTDPDDPDVVAATVVNCDYKGRGFYFGNNEDANSVLAGLTIKNAAREGEPPPPLQGAGILCSSSPTIINCTITNNHSACADGAGIYNSGDPTLINCTFSNNHASPSLMNCMLVTHGGGMYNTGNPTLINCTFRGNYACDAGGIHNTGSPVLINCTISSNGARYAGGIRNSGNPTLINCIISNNTAWYYDGGGMYSSGNPILFGCVFLSNNAGSESDPEGGGLYCLSGSPTIVNCTFSDNFAPGGGGGGVYNNSGTPTLSNCIVWGNTGGQIVGSGVTVSFSDVQGGYTGTENINADPLFVGGGYLQLSPGSPCIDAGNNFAVPPDTADIDEDGDTTEPIPLDIAGYARFLDDPNTADSGMGTPPIVDMGAYEYQGPLPYLEVWPGTFDFVSGGEDPDDQILYISNEGGGTLLWEVEEDCFWLDADPNSGECTGETDEVVLSVDANGLSRGTYNCQLTVSSNAINGPITVQVNLFVDTALLVPSAYPTIQAAIDAADGGDTVIVAPGIYTGDGNRDIDFKDKAITVRSADPNDPNIVAATVIDCNGSDIEQHRGFSFYRGEGLDSILAGFTITNGYADDWGSAISCRDYSSPTIRNCIITGNVNGYGGGIYCIYYASPTISNCTISGNSAMRGGGIYCYDNGNATISNSIITGNSSLDSGGGIYCKYSDITINNCTLANNQSDSQGGGITSWDSTATVTNSIIWGNTAPTGPEAAVLSGSAVTVSYSDFTAYVDGGSTLNYGLGNIYVDPCFVDPCNGDYHLKSQGWRWDENVGHGSPWKGDYLTSRCIDAGNPGSPLGDELLTIPNDPNQDWGVNLRINMGAYGGTVQASMAPYNWALLGDLSNDGTADFVDFAGQAKDWLITANEQPGDLTRDSIVGIEDLAALVEDWLQTTDWFE